MAIVIALISSAVLVAVDQILKVWVLNTLAGEPSVILIPGLLQLTYVENRGAAFGLFQGRIGILSIVTMAVILVGIVLMISGKLKHKLEIISASLIIAGGLGNLIDRIFRMFVVDFLDISPLFSFPVFNFADCCVVIGTFIMIIYLFFFEGKGRDNVLKSTNKIDETKDGDKNAK